jgi:hypothetical protein
MLVPQSVAVSGDAVAGVTNIPLPAPRPKMVVTAAARSSTTGSVPAKPAKRRH